MNQLATIKRHPLETVDLSSLKAGTKEVLKATVAKHTTDDELSYFLTVAMSHGLDPFNKEIWAYKRAKKNKDGNYDYENSDLIVMTGRDGYAKIAKRNPNFKQMVSQAVYENDTFAADPIGNTVEHRFSSKSRGNLIGAYAVIIEKDGSRHFKYVTLSEYKDSYSKTWESKPSAMLCKCAESILYKQYGGISGLQAEETMQYDDYRTSSSPQIEEQTGSLKQGLLDRINACKTIKQLDDEGKKVQIEMAKLFEHEKEEVISAGIEKRKELALLEPKTDVVEIKMAEPEDPSQPTIYERNLLSIDEFEDVGELITFWEKKKLELRNNLMPKKYIELLSSAYETRKSHLTKSGAKKLK